MLNLIQRNFTRVLAYHRVNDYDDPYFGTHVNDFDEHMKFLKTYYSPIDMATYIEHILDNNPLPRNSVIITIDDGYEDNYFFAYPILKKYSIPATIFLTTDFVNRKMWMWNDIYRYILGNAKPGFSARIMNNTEKNLERGLLEARNMVWNDCRKMPKKERVDFLEDLAGFLKVQLPDLPPKRYAALTWDQIEEMSKDCINFGGHTCSHEILTTLPHATVDLQISNCKKEIEDKLQKETISFSYPNGEREDFNQEIKAIVRLRGFKSAFTMIYGTNNHQTDPFEMKRIPIGNIDLAKFITAISPFEIVKQRIKTIISSTRLFPSVPTKQKIRTYIQ